MITHQYVVATGLILPLQHAREVARGCWQTAGPPSKVAAALAQSRPCQTSEASAQLEWRCGLCRDHIGDAANHARDQLSACDASKSWVLMYHLMPCRSCGRQHIPAGGDCRHWVTGRPRRSTSLSAWAGTWASRGSGSSGFMRHCTPTGTDEAGGCSRMLYREADNGIAVSYEFVGRSSPRH